MPGVQPRVALRAINMQVGAAPRLPAAVSRSSPRVLTAAPRVHRRWDRFYALPSVPHTVVGMPALSPTMETGTLAEWNVKVGDKISAGDLIAQVETDKATIGFETTDDGYIAKLLIEPGTGGIQIGQPVAIVVSNKGAIEQFSNVTLADLSSGSSSSSSAPAPKQNSPSSAPTATSTSSSASAPSGPQPDTVLRMPALSPTMTSGRVASWSKKVGDKISIGDVIADIETDKATIAFEVTDEGYIAKFLVKEGEDVNLGDPVAILVRKKDQIDQWKDFTASMVASGSSTASSASSTPSSSAAPAPAESAPSSAPSTSFTPSSGSRQSASPRARMEAKNRGVDIAQVSGTGPAGRIIAADVVEFSQRAPVETKAPAPAAAQAIPTLPEADFVDIPNSTIRRITAERLTLSKTTIPHYYLSMDVRVDALMALRTQLNALSTPKSPFKLSVNDFVVKAAALALRDNPSVNSEWRGDKIRQYRNIDINVAVNTERGLLTPIVRAPHQIGLKAINERVKAAATRAQEGKSSADDLAMGTFTISNLGMFGINHFSAVINPPQAAILAVGTVQERAILAAAHPDEGERLVRAQYLTVTLSCDHRVIDGAIGAEWLQSFRDYLENPSRMML